MDSNNNYHKIVWIEAAKEAKHFLWSDKKTLAGNIVLAVVSGFATTLFLDLWSQTAVIPLIIQLLAILIGTLIGFIVLYLFNLGWGGLWEIPLRMFREKEKEANKFTWNDVLVSIDPNLRENPDGACIRVCNRKSWTIQGGTAQIVNVVRDGVPRSNLVLPFVPWIKDWGARTHIQTLGAECALEKAPFISLAAWDSTGGWLNTIEENHESKKISLDKDVPYKFMLEWRGEVDGRRMDEYRTRYLIKWTDSGLELTNIE